MIDILVEMALKEGYTLDSDTIAILREMYILHEIASDVRGEPGKTYSIEEADELTKDDIDLEDFLQAPQPSTAKKE